MEIINQIIAFLKSGHVDAIVVFVLLAVEFWLGKTEIVKPGSTVEVILVGIKKVLGFIKGLIAPKA